MNGMRILQALLVTSLLALPVFCAQKPAVKKQLGAKQAEEIALKLAPGGKIMSKELEREEGKLVWSFDIKEGNNIREIWLDAGTGAVVQDKLESAAEEKAEAAKDKAEAKAKAKAKPAPAAKPAKPESSGETKTAPGQGTR